MKKILCLVLAVVMVCAMSTGVFAEETINMNGEIGVQTITDPGSDNTTFSLTVPASVNFYVTEDSYPAVFNTNTAIDTPNPNSITNTNALGVPYYVCLSAVAPVAGSDAAAVTATLDLQLTGDLLADPVTSATNLAAGPYANTTKYADQLFPGTENAWTFGFTGSFSGNLPVTRLEPKYTMTLDFSLEA